MDAVSREEHLSHAATANFSQYGVLVTNNRLQLRALLFGGDHGPIIVRRQLWLEHANSTWLVRDARGHFLTEVTCIALSY